MTSDQQRKLTRAMQLIQDVDWNTANAESLGTAYALIRQVVSEANPFTEHWESD